MLPYKKSKSPIKKFTEENETGKFYLVLKILAGAKKEKDWNAVDSAVETLNGMLEDMKESKKRKSFLKEGDTASLEEVIELFKKGWKATPKIINKSGGLLEVPTGHKFPIGIKVLD